MIITADTKTLGSYSVGNQQFLFKMDALRAANNNANNIVFHFNDALYQSFDCTRDPEPTLTLKDEKPIMGLVSDKNFIVSNAVENILAAPKLPANNDKDYLKKKNYGKVPKYL